MYSSNCTVRVETPAAWAEAYSLPMAYIAMPKRVTFSQAHSSSTTAISKIGLGRRSGMASPTKKSTIDCGALPPGLSITSSVTPCRMNMVDRVTTMGCMRMTAMKNPLNAPVSAPTPTPTASTVQGDTSGLLNCEATTTLTSETVAPADRSKPPDKITSVWPMAAMASVAPDAEMFDTS